MDVACLQEMLEVYLATPDLNHSWEEIHEAVKKIGGDRSVLINGVSCKLLHSVTLQFSSSNLITYQLVLSRWLR